MCSTEQVTTRVGWLDPLFTYKCRVSVLLPLEAAVLDAVLAAVAPWGITSLQRCQGELLVARH